MFCSKTCCQQYKSQKSIKATCEFCKLEKVLHDTINYNLQDVSFCSEGERYRPSGPRLENRSEH